MEDEKVEDTGTPVYSLVGLAKAVAQALTAQLSTTVDWRLEGIFHGLAILTVWNPEARRYHVRFEVNGRDIILPERHMWVEEGSRNEGSEATEFFSEMRPFDKLPSSYIRRERDRIYQLIVNRTIPPASRDRFLTYQRALSWALDPLAVPLWEYPNPSTDIHGGFIERELLALTEIIKHHPERKECYWARDALVWVLDPLGTPPSRPFVDWYLPYQAD